MVPAVTRRRVLALGAGGLAGVVGYQSLPVSDSQVPIQIHVLNTTNENLEVWVQLTSPDPDVEDQLGESLLLEPGAVERLAVTVPTANYQLRIATDDTTSRLEQTVPWEITERDCGKQSYATVVSAGTDAALQVVAGNCE
jgi:hypothetical protein